MVEDFIYVLENYPNMDLSTEADRRVVADALWNYMCEHHIIVHSDLEAHCKNKEDRSD